MDRMPLLSGKEIVKRFLRLGYRFARQEGSHMRLIHNGDPDRYAPLSVPNHREVRKGLLRKLLRDADITVKEFNELK
jgi:predicted RNA binding protein YcfA (HicA-like mRNA interferase family)